MANVWTPDWQERIRDAARSLGYEDCYSFVMSRPGASFGEMFGELRNSIEERNSIAFSQLSEVFYCDAHRRGLLRDAFAEALARSIRNSLKSGWNRGKKVRERRIDARMGWPFPHLVSHANWRHSQWHMAQERAWQLLEGAQPSDEWCPADGNDAIVQDVISKIWDTA
jgi:hypothetical protein